MALGDPYVTLADLKSWLGIEDTHDDQELTSALEAASRSIERVTRRQFNKDTSVTPAATARVFTPDQDWLAYVDDFHTAAGLEVRTGDGDGEFDTVWTGADYVLGPPNGIVDGTVGWPYWKIHARAVGAHRFDPGATQSLQVTAHWGWAEVPAPIQHAATILAAELFKLKDAPFGVAGFGEYGVVRVRDNPKVWALVRPYARNQLLVR